MKLEHLVALFLGAVAMVGLIALFMGAKLMRTDTETCRDLGGIQLETPSGRVCASKDILLNEKK